MDRDRWFKMVVGEKYTVGFTTTGAQIQRQGLEHDRAWQSQACNFRY